MFIFTDPVIGRPLVRQVIVYFAPPSGTVARYWPVNNAEEKLDGPETIQLVTSVAVHEIVDVAFALTRVRLAVIDACGWRTVTVAHAGAEPPAPVHVTP